MILRHTTYSNCDPFVCKLILTMPVSNIQLHDFDHDFCHLLKPEETSLPKPLVPLEITQWFQQLPEYLVIHENPTWTARYLNHTEQMDLLARRYFPFEHLPVLDVIRIVFSFLVPNMKEQFLEWTGPDWCWNGCRKIPLSTKPRIIVQCPSIVTWTRHNSRHWKTECIYLVDDPQISFRAQVWHRSYRI